MMTLKEAIKHAKEMSGNQYVCEECKNEQKQLAEWLEELDLINKCQMREKACLQNGKVQINGRRACSKKYLIMYILRSNVD